MGALFMAAGLSAGPAVTIPAPLPVRIWSAFAEADTRPLAAVLDAAPILESIA
jgi:hypothetical protein